MLESNSSKFKQNQLRFMKDTNVPLPSLIEISNSGMCNRKCTFCPRSAPDYPHINEFFSDKLHTKLCKQLSEHDFDGTFVYAGFNEPLLHKKIYEHVKEARFFLKNARIEIITNGDVLNEDRLNKLMSAGLTTISISAYDNLEQAKKFEKLCIDSKLDENQYIVRHRYLPPKEKFGIRLTNRGGAMKNAEYKIKSLNEPSTRPCFYPSYDFFVDYNGDVLMCSHDWLKKNVLGNLDEQDFSEIWLGKKAQISREKLYNSNRNFKPCNVCDAQGAFIGKDHVKEWKKVYQK